jgi:peroxin-5
MAGNAFGTVANRFGLNLVPQNYRQGFAAHSPVLDSNGKGKFKEIDFDAAFAQVVSSFETAHAKVEEQTSGVVDPVEELEKDLRQAKLDDVSVVTPEEAIRQVEFKRFVVVNAVAATLMAYSCSVWNQMQNSDMPPNPEEFARWETEFNQLMYAQREDGEWDYSAGMQHAWEDGAQMDDTFVHNLKFDHEGFPVLDPYVFGLFSLPYNFSFPPYSLSTEENNKYLDPSSSTPSPLALAKQMLEQNAALSEIALLLEAAIQKGELGEGGYEAWILLGETRNMDEREEAGMRALSEGVRLAEEAGAAGAGMLVCYLLDSSTRVLLTELRNSRWQSPTRTNRSIALPIRYCCAGCAHVSPTRRSRPKRKRPSPSHRGICMTLSLKRS